MIRFDVRQHKKIPLLCGFYKSTNKNYLDVYMTLKYRYCYNEGGMFTVAKFNDMTEGSRLLDYYHQRCIVTDDTAHMVKKNILTRSWRL